MEGSQIMEGRHESHRFKFKEKGRGKERRDRLTPGNLREGLAGKAALLIKVKDQGSSAFVLWEYPPFNMDIND